MSEDDVRRLAEALAAARRIVAFTGAGISTESGIPDFRGPQGIWTKVDPADFTIQNYLANAEHRKRVWRMRIENFLKTYKPNAAHQALAELEGVGILDCVITQNIDGLHQRAGSTQVLELHGHTREAKCMRCDRRWPTEEITARVGAGDEDPHCRHCDGIIKVCTVSFGEPLPPDVLAESLARAEACDLCLVVGSSLVVYPAADVPLAAARGGARLAIVNAEPTPLDGFADPMILGTAGEVLPAAVAAARRMLGAR